MENSFNHLAHVPCLGCVWSLGPAGTCVLLGARLTFSSIACLLRGACAFIERHKMTVEELREALEPFDGEALVVMSRDSEGNSYSPLHGYWLGAYNHTTGRTGLNMLTEKDKEEGYTESDVVKNGVNAIVLYPEV